MQIRLLGSIDVIIDGNPMPVPGVRRKAVLAALALQAGRIVSADSLIDIVWGDAAPATAANTLQSHISNLRRPLGQRAPILARVPGYVLDVGEDAIDVSTAERLIREGTKSADPGAATARLQAAIGLWRGRPLADLAGLPWFDEQAGRLDQLLLQARQALTDGRLALGQHLEVVPELEDLSREHPFNEPVHGQLMLALYRAGRQADALAVYQRLRHALDDDLGISPGQHLRDLESAILRQDPILVLSAPASPAAAIVPAQLPPAMPAFAGRDEEISKLDRLLAAQGAGTTIVISAFSGMAGVGKTALAVHWAHRVAAQFPDGQLYINLRGFDPTGGQLDPADALSQLLDALGVPADKIPDDLDARAALYRSRLSGKRALLLLDNARDSAQVRPLLPGVTTCPVLVTSRGQLTGLVAADGAHHVNINPLTFEQSRELLTYRLGAKRIIAEPEAVEEIIIHCARLPLALAIVAARATVDPQLPLRALANALRDSHNRLDTLTTDDPRNDVRTVFSWSYRQLSPAACRLFRLLGSHPGPDITAPAAASLAGATNREAKAQLAELARCNQIVEHAPGRFALHDLLRAYSVELASTVDSSQERAAARVRMYDHYLHSAHAADRLLEMHRDPIALAEVQAGVTPEEFADSAAAMRWLNAERAVLRGILAHATATGLNQRTIQLPWTLIGYYEMRGYRKDRDAALRSAMEAAVRLGDRATQARAHRGFAVALVRQGKYQEMEHHLTQAWRIHQDLNDRRGLAHVHSLAGGALLLHGRIREALTEFEHSREHHRALGDEVNEANALNAIASCLTELGDHKAAIAHCEQALDKLERQDNVINLASTIDTIGQARLRLGQHEEASACFEKARKLFRDAGDRYLSAAVGVHYADSEFAMGHTAAARDAWRKALTILEDLEHPDAAAVRAKLVEHRPS